MNQLLTQGFSRFLRRRRVQRHFQRRPALVAQGSATAAAPAGVMAALGQDLLAAAHDDPAAALQRLQSQADGLERTEAALRLAHDGPNEIAHEPPLPAWLHLWRCYVNPFNLLLTALAALSLLSADAKATVVIGVMVALSTGIRFVQEGRSHRTAEGLRALVSNKASVIRRSAGAVPQTSPGPGPGAAQEIAQRELVAGDVVALSAGDMVPAATCSSPRPR
jgi:P-type Mg2+ transporter